MFPATSWTGPSFLRQTAVEFFTKRRLMPDRKNYFDPSLRLMIAGVLSAAYVLAILIVSPLPYLVSSDRPP
ncbi:hypothetical protein BS47DRAFT_1394107 [Hydnum rufescens UP504]|uniref:Uncharacterized protein n=1 Tax=Hydnum rufescens UP504 TaxID=1448309 RepID=A0A9P6AVM6_9AGAM|nr:hypothetical protein BS47DRAFT_1394107 [Hydnum rufescens UP504]